MYVQMSDTWDNYYFRVSGKTIIIIINTNIIITTIIFIPEYGRGGLPWWLGNEVSATQEKQEMGVRSLGREDPLEKSTATHSSILSWRILWTEESGRLQFHGVTQNRTWLSDFHFHNTHTKQKTKQETKNESQIVNTKSDKCQKQRCAHTHTRRTVQRKEKKI